MKTEITPSEHANQSAKDEPEQVHKTNREKYLGDINLLNNESEESLKFTALFHHSSVGVAFHKMLFDEQGNPVDYLFLDANERFIELTGIDPRGKLVTEAFPGIEKDAANWIKTYGDVVLTGNNIRFSQYLEFDNKWYDCMASTYKPNHFMVTFADITESKKTKKQIQEVASFFQSIIENAPDGIALINEQGQFKYISVSGRRMFGYTDDETTNIDPAKQTHPDDLELVLSHLMQVIANPAYIPTIQYRFANKMGNWIWIETTFRNLLHDSNVASIIMNFRDISKQKFDDLIIKEKDVQYRNLANSSPILIWTSGKDKMCNYFNKTWLNFTGRTLEEEVGNGWSEGIHPEDFDHCLATYNQSFEKQEPFEMEYRLKHRSGQYRWILDIGTPNYNCENEFIGYIGNCIDITERKEMLNQLQISEEKFRNSFELSPIPKLLTSIDEKINVNKSFCDLIGYSTTELSHMKWMDFTHPDDIEYSKVIVNSLISGEIHSASWLKRYIHKDGHIIWVNATIILLRDINNIPYHYVTEVYDISARKYAEEALRESEELFKKAFIINPDGVSISDLETGVYIKTSDGSTTLFGYSEEELIGKSSLELNIWVNPNDRKRWIQLLKQYESVVNFETRIRKKNNTIIDTLVSATIIELKGEKHVLSVVRDITERKLAEEKLAESELFFRQSQEAAQIGSYRLDMATGVWSSSDVLCHIFGIDNTYEKNVFGWRDIVAEDDRAMMIDYVENYVFGGRNRFDKEYRICRQSDNEMSWVHGLGELIIENDTIIAMVGTIQDITKRKNAEIELQQNMETLRRFHNLTVGRELNMIELKKEINELLIQAGKKPKYKIIE